MDHALTDQPRRAVFLDRDGTLNFDGGYTHRVEDLQLMDQVVEGLREIQGMGFDLIVVTNQSGIARGRFTIDQLHAFHEALAGELARHEVYIKAFYYCTWHPEAKLAEHRGQSPLRKPEPGMLLQAAADHKLDLAGSYMIGDKLDDVLAGQRAGCHGSILVLSNGQPTPGTPGLEVTPEATVSNLLEAAGVIRSWL